MPTLILVCQTKCFDGGRLQPRLETVWWFMDEREHTLCLWLHKTIHCVLVLPLSPHRTHTQDMLHQELLFYVLSYFISLLLRSVTTIISTRNSRIWRKEIWNDATVGSCHLHFIKRGRWKDKSCEQMTPFSQATLTPLWARRALAPEEGDEDGWTSERRHFLY